MKNTISKMLLLITLVSGIISSLSAVSTSKYLPINTIVSNCPKAPFYSFTMDSQDNMYVIDKLEYRYELYKISTQGRCTKITGFPKFEDIGGALAIDIKRKIIYIAKYSTVKQYNFKGKLIKEWNKAGHTDMSTISSMVLDKHGNLYVVTGDNYIHKFSNREKFLLTWGGSGEYDGKFKGISSIAIDKYDKVYVADSGNYRIQKFDSSGNFITKWGHKAVDINDDTDIYGIASLKTIAIDKDSNIYVYYTDNGNNYVKIFYSNGDYIKSKKLEKKLDYYLFASSYCSYIDNSGYQYIFSRYYKSLQKLDKNFQHIDGWGVLNYGKGEFTSYTDIVFDKQDNIYILDKLFSRIQKFSTNGKFITKWKTFDYQGDSDWSMAINNEDEIYVFIGREHKIQRFNNMGKLLQTINIKNDTVYGPDSDYYFWNGDIAIDGKNNLYYLNTSNKTIYVYDRYGKKIRTFLVKLNFSEHLSKRDKYHITIDKKRNYLYLSSSTNIIKYNLMGKILTGWDINPRKDTYSIGINISLIDGKIYVHKKGYSDIKMYIYSNSGILLETENVGNLTNPDAVISMGINSWGNIFVGMNNRLYKKITNPDIDHDGVINEKDAFPFNPHEWVDTDHDGIGNNADKDDDNDGLLDTIEIKYNLNPLNSSDVKADFDHDGFSNALEISIGTNIRNKNSKPIWTPIIMDNIMIMVPTKA